MLVTREYREDIIVLGFLSLFTLWTYLGLPLIYNSDTVASLTLAKWETVSGQFGGYLNDLRRVAMGSANFVAMGANLAAQSRDWDWLVGIATFLLVLVTAIIFILQSRQNRRALKIDLLFKLDDRFNTLKMRASRRKAAAFLQGVHTEGHHLAEVLDFFEHVGYLLRAGALDHGAAWSAFYHHEHHWYTKAKKHITRQREEDPTIWRDLEYLNKQLVFEQMRQLRCTEDDKSIKLGDEGLDYFLKNESKA